MSLNWPYIFLRISKLLIVIAFLQIHCLAFLVTKSYNEEKAEKLGITLPVKLLQSIDNIRGDVPRSKFIRRAIELPERKMKR